MMGCTIAPMGKIHRRHLYDWRAQQYRWVADRLHFGAEGAA
ncbi:hypothetical protein [Azospirillum largimobile]